MSSPPVRHRSRRMRTLWLGAASVAMVGVLAACSSSGGTSTTSQSSSSSGSSSSASASGPDLSYYSGKTITWDTPDPPGSAFYTVPTILAPLIGKYLHATVNVVSIPAGVTIAGQNTAAAAKNDGLTIGTLHVAGNVANAATKKPNINFDMTQVAVIAGLPINQVVWTVSPKSPYKTWQALVDSHAQIKAASITGNVELVQQAAYGAYGIQAKMIVGYENSADQIAGFLRGDADITAQSVPSLASSITAGKAVPILLSAPYTAALDGGTPQLQGVTDLGTYAKSHPPTGTDGSAAIAAALALYGATAVNQGFFAPKGTDPSKVAALTAAFQSAINDPATQAEFVKQDLAGTYLSPTAVLAAIDTAVKSEPALAQVQANYKG